MPPGPGHDLVLNGFSTVWAALLTVYPGLSYADFMGFTAGAWLTCHGQTEGTPLWLAEVSQILPAGLQRLGYTAEISDGDAFDSLYSSLYRESGSRQPPKRRLIAARLNAFEGQILSPGNEGREWETVATSGTRASGRKKFEPWVYIRVRRTPGAAGLLSHRQLAALTDGLATMFRPTFLVDRGDSQPAEAAVGLAAYDLWADTLHASSAITASGHAAFRHQADAWNDAHRAAAVFLHGLAGAQRTAYANRLRRAAELLAKETADYLTPLTILSRKAVPQEAPALMDGAARSAEDAAHLLAEAVFIALHLPAVAVDALLQQSGEPLSGMALQEMLYLARAGTPPLRLLAARRLAGSEGPQVVSTLGQLLYDADYRVRQTAIWSLEEIGPPGLARTLRSALYSGEVETVALVRLHLVALRTPEAEQALADWHADTA
jgi:hypothetical protein